MYRAEEWERITADLAAESAVALAATEVGERSMIVPCRCISATIGIRYRLSLPARG